MENTVGHLSGQTESSAIKKLIIIMILCISIFFIQSWLPRKYHFIIGGDGFHYYSYARSLIVDKNFNIDNEIQYINSRFHPSLPKLRSLYYWPLGSGVTWSPALLLGISIEHFTGFSGFSGFSRITQLLVSLLSMFYAFLGIWLSLESIRRIFPDISLNWSTIFIPFTTPLLYYLLFSPVQSHLPSLCAIALLFYIYTKYFYKTHSNLGHYLLFYAVGGLATLIRWNNILYFMILLLAILFQHFTLKDIRNNILSLPTFFFTFAPQLLFWKSIFGSYFHYPHSHAFLSPFSPKIFDLLFSMKHGLFSWTPIFLFSFLGAFGFLLFKKRNRILLYIYYGTFFSQLYLNSIVSDWWAGASFGQRRFIDFLPFLLIGIVILNKYKKSITNFIIWCLLLFNILFVLQYQTGRIPPADPITYKQYLIDKLTVPYEVIKKIAEILK